MAKKSSKKTPSQAQEIANVEEQKPSSTQKKPGSEIDEIFSGKKGKKSKAEKIEKYEDVTKKPKKSKKNMKKKSKGSAGVGDIADPPPPFRRRKTTKTTEDGLTIYTEEELGINKADAGSTPLRPFDCSCYF